MGLRHAVLFSALWISAGGAGALADTSKPKGCYTPVKQCLSVTQNTSSGISFYNHACTDRVYVRVCQQRGDKSWHCGNFGIAKSNSHIFETDDASSVFHYVFTGSTGPSTDRVCASRIAGWSRTPPLRPTTGP